MSRSIIDELYYGKRGNCDNIKMSKQYWKVIDKIVEVEAKLCKDFNIEQTDLFKEFDSLQGELQNESQLAGFKAGLKIGLRLGLECILEDKQKEE